MITRERLAPVASHADGGLTMLTMGNGGMPLVDWIEVGEMHYPILIHKR